jgi:tRNA (guanine37-N1)-methyltransferase
MVKDLTSSDILFDVFAGIGPFAVPAAKKKVTVFANDLNPYSYESLLKNIKLNKCDTGSIYCSNMDGREFIQTVMKQELTNILTSEDSYRGARVENITSITVLMNLPALAFTFLDAFYGLLGDIKTFNKQVPVPIVHCYCFTNMAEATEKFSGDMDQEIKHRLASVLKNVEEEEIAVRFVRNVAPQKNMMCASFRLTPEILQCKNSEKRTQNSADGMYPG